MINVLPINDKYTHREDEFCMCNPKIDNQDADKIIIHNAFDGRDFVEIESKNKELT